MLPQQHCGDRRDHCLWRFSNLFSVSSLVTLCLGIGGLLRDQDGGCPRAIIRVLRQAGILQSQSLALTMLGHCVVFFDGAVSGQ